MVRDLSFVVMGLPPGMNKTIRMHWAKYREARQLWSVLVRQAIGRNMWSYPGRVSVEYTAYRTRLMDYDNHVASFKLVGDALVDYEIIGDDGPEVIDSNWSAYVQSRVRRRSEERIEVVIKDLEG